MSDDTTTSGTTGDTSPAAPTGDFELRVSRVIPATPDEVFDAYTSAEKQRIWFNIIDAKLDVVEIEVDLRVGGVQTSVWGPNRETLFRETQTFLEIDRPNRLVTSSTGSGPDGEEMTTHIEVTFEPDAGGTLVTVHQTGLPNPEMRDFFQKVAWQGAFDRIAAYVGSVEETRA